MSHHRGPIEFGLAQFRPARGGSPEPIERRVFSAGDEIFREGARGRRAFLIQEGVVELQSGGSDRRMTVERLGAHCIFGEMALILDDAPRPTSAVAVARTQVMVIRDLLFKKKLEQSDPFLRAIVRLLANNLRETPRRRMAYAASGPAPFGNLG
ncbi:MAG: cyclic nucleotide-binding domain-containing protein [Alphaproteobacteria bacterium]|nr:cyclic nucleotide-binding domain-containing protein [Alphaproteobacteria bacterium]